MDTLAILKSNELFCGLTDEELKLLATLATKRTVLKNSQVIGLGDISSALYLIKSGKVKVVVNNVADCEQREMILSTLEAGDHFGELSLLDGEARSASIVTLEKSEFIIIHRSDFFNLLEKHSSIALGVIKYLCKRVRLLTHLAEDLALLDVYGRMVKLLESMAEPLENGKRILQTPLTHNDIALRISASREMVSRILNELEKGQYITIEHKIITLNRKLPSAR